MNTIKIFNPLLIKIIQPHFENSAVLYGMELETYKTPKLPQPEQLQIKSN